METFKVEFHCPECEEVFHEIRIRPHRKSKVTKICPNCKNKKDNKRVATEGWLNTGSGSCNQCIHFQPYSNSNPFWGTCGLDFQGVDYDDEGKNKITKYVYYADYCHEQEDK